MTMTSKEWAAKAREMTDAEITFALNDIKETMHNFPLLAPLYHDPETGWSNLASDYADRLNAERDSLITERLRRQTERRG